MASSRTAAYDPAKPMPAMITAPNTTTPMRTRCIRVSCRGAATRTPLPVRVVARNRVAHVCGVRIAGTRSVLLRRGLRQTVRARRLLAREPGTVVVDGHDDVLDPDHHRLLPEGPFLLLQVV